MKPIWLQLLKIIHFNSVLPVVVGVDLDSVEWVLLHIVHYYFLILCLHGLVPEHFLIRLPAVSLFFELVEYLFEVVGLAAGRLFCTSHTAAFLSF